MVGQVGPLLSTANQRRLVRPNNQQERLLNPPQPGASALGSISVEIFYRYRCKTSLFVATFPHQFLFCSLHTAEMKKGRGSEELILEMNHNVSFTTRIPAMKRTNRVLGSAGRLWFHQYLRERPFVSRLGAKLTRCDEILCVSFSWARNGLIR